MLFDTEIGSGGLALNQSSQPIEVAFNVAVQDRFDFDVTLLERNNRPPRFTSVLDPQATVGTTYSARVEGVDPDGSRLVYSLLTSPTGMTINSQTGLIIWPVQANQVGSHQVTVQASDGRGGSATQRYTLTASAAAFNRPPLILSAPITTISPGSNYRYQLSARDPDNQTLQYALVSGPTGMSVQTRRDLLVTTTRLLVTTLCS